METLREHYEFLTRAVGETLTAIDVSVLTDDDLLESTRRLEELGRVVDAARVAHAAEIDDRSRVEHGADRLSATKGCANANELVQRLTLVAPATAEKRIRLGRETRRNRSLVGVVFPARFDHVAHALDAGHIGIDAAWAIVSTLVPVLPRAAIDDLVAAEIELVAAATGTSVHTPVPCTAADIRGQATVWQVFLDPDGVEPREDRAMAKRGFRLGRVRGGLVPVAGDLLPEIAGKLGAVFDSYINPRTESVFLSDADAEIAGVEGDTRTRPQKQHDILASLIDAAARSGELPSAGGAPPTVLVSVRIDDLASGSGAGYIDGLEAPVSVRAIRQFACAGGVQRVLFTDDGGVIELGSPSRCFTPQQRRAIALRDGGCVIPGCRVPAAWCEIHHVVPDRDGGPTSLANGVMLCWFHHRTIDTAGWDVRMENGVPHIKAPPWIDPNAQWKPASGSRTARALRRDSG